MGFNSAFKGLKYSIFLLNESSDLEAVQNTSFPSENGDNE
jgi:hypothetical protein